MPAIEFSDFATGLDRRKARDVSDANRLWELTNAYVTTGKQLGKRPGLRKIATLEAGTIGLIAGGGVLNTFSADASIAHADTLFRHNFVPNGGLAVSRVHYGDVFAGYLYAAVEYQGGTIKHHYLDDPGAWASSTAYTVGNFRRPTTANGFRYEVTSIAGSGTSAGSEPTWPTTEGATVTDNPGANQVVWTCRSFAVTDTNCPHSNGVTKQAQSIFAVDEEVVRFSATDAPRDWTTASDAGFLATGRQQTGATDALALAEFQKQLAIFFVDGLQIWDIDPDPALMTIRQRIANVGTRYPHSPLPFNGDVFFLSDVGFRSVLVSQQTDNIQDSDVGSPIDKLVKPGLVAGINPLSVFYPGGGQFWCIIGNYAWVYTFSRASKIAAWSKYTFPFQIEAAASLNGELYLRSGDSVYRVDEDYYTDDGTAISVLVEMPFLSNKAPGILKQFFGFDVAMIGSASISFRFDPRTPSFQTQAIAVSGNTQPGVLNGMEFCSTHVAPVIEHAANEEWELHSLVLYYENLAPYV